MTTRPCADPIPLDELVAYERGELSADDEARAEEHFFACAHCARRLDDLHRLRAAVARLARGGGLTSGATAELVQRAADAGVAIRTYRLEPGDTVACTCAPDDAFVAVHLAAAVAPDEHVDIDIESLAVASGDVARDRRDELVVDRGAGEVIVLYSGDAVRAFPRSQWTMHLRARGPAGERTLGPYTLDHTPWEELDAPGDGG